MSNLMLIPVIVYGGNFDAFQKMFYSAYALKEGVFFEQIKKTT